MTAEFRLVLCEPATAARVKAAAKRKAKMMKGKFHGPLLPAPAPEWEVWYHAQRGVVIPLPRAALKPHPVRAAKAA